MKNLAFYPYEDNTAFLLKWREQIEKAGFNIIDFSDISKRQLSNNEVDIVFLNWYEEIHSRKTIRACAQMLKRMMKIHSLKSHGARIITVIHNRTPHENDHPKCTSTLRNYLLKASTYIVVLSDASKSILKKDLGRKAYNSIENRLKKLPLPNYINVYPDDNKAFSRETFNISVDTPIFLALGNLRPYKNIELIFRLASTFYEKKLPSLFVIAGKPFSQEYGKELSAIADQLPNVVFLDRYIPDEDISSLVSLSDAMVVPMNTNSSINSSEIILAFSFKKPVIAPSIPTALEYPVEANFLYSYNSVNVHFEKLLEATLEAYEDILSQRHIKKGESLYLCVSKQNSEEVIFEHLKEILNVMQ